MIYSDIKKTKIAKIIKLVISYNLILNLMLILYLMSIDIIIRLRRMRSVK